MPTNDRLCYCIDCDCMTIDDCLTKDCNCCTYMSQKGEDIHYGDQREGLD